MKFLYIVPSKVLNENHYLNGKQLPRHSLFNEFHFIDLENDLVLVSGSFPSSWHQEAWQLHGLVGRLQHPVHEKDAKVCDLKTLSHKNFTKEHEDALVKTLKISSDATIQDISDAAKKIHPQMSLGAWY